MEKLSGIAWLSQKQIKYLKSLQRKKVRCDEGRACIEGIRLLEDALNAQAPLVYAVYSPALLASTRGQELLERLIRNDIPLFVTTDQMMKGLADTQTPQGIIAVVEIKYSTLEKALANVSNPFLVVAAGIQDPGNLGTIIRTAEAGGSHAVILTSGTVDLYNPKTIRSTMGTVFYLPIINQSDFTTVVSCLRQRGIKLVAGDLNARLFHFAYDFTVPVALVLGNEANGLARNLLDMMDDTVKIPILGKAESLNVATAGSILVYEVVRQRIKAGF